MTMLLLRQHYGRESNGVGPLTEFLIAFYAGVFFTKSATGPQCLLALLVCTGISFSMTRRYSLALFTPPIALTARQLLPSCLAFGFCLVSFWGMVLVAAANSNWVALALTVVGVGVGTTAGLLIPKTMVHMPQCKHFRGAGLTTTVQIGRASCRERV